MGGGWGSEERHSPYFPFMPNANFDMIIMAEGHRFKVSEKYCNYDIRLFKQRNFNLKNVSSSVKRYHFTA